MLDTAHKIQQHIKARFNYVYDRDQFPDRFDNWQYTLEDGMLFDDCDGFAMWAFDLAREAGLSVRIVTCFVPGRDGLVGHAICYFEDEGLAVDNIQERAFTPSKVGYVYGSPKPGLQAKISELNSISQWYALNGWEA
jgi:hypothetical protein